MLNEIMAKEISIIDENQINLENKIKPLFIKVLISLSISTLLIWGSFPYLMETAPLVLRNHWVQFLLATPVQLWAGWDFYYSAFSALKKRKANMDTLVALGTSVTYIYSIFIVLYPDIASSIGIESMPHFGMSSTVIALILLVHFF